MMDRYLSIAGGYVGGRYVLQSKVYRAWRRSVGGKKRREVDLARYSSPVTNALMLWIDTYFCIIHKMHQDSFGLCDKN